MASKQVKDTAKALIQEFCDWYREAKGVAYTPNIVRDHPRMTEMVEFLGAKEVKSLIKEYFKGTGVETSLTHFFFNYDKLIKQRESAEKDKAHIEQLMHRTGIKVNQEMKRARGES